MKPRGRAAVLAVGAFAFLLVSSLFLAALLSPGPSYFYGSAYEGVDVNLEAVYYAPENYYYDPDLGYYVGYGEARLYTRGQPHGASLLRLDTTLGFDPDAPRNGKPDLVGETTGVFVPKAGEVQLPSWVPGNIATEVSRLTQAEPKPERTFTWSTPGGDKLFQMDEWRLLWLVTISADWQGGEGGTYTGVEVWFRLTLTPKWYFEAQPDRTYFAIAKIVLRRVDWTGKTPSTVRFVPMSEGSILPIYYSVRGEKAYEELSENEASNWGVGLNTRYFRDTVYTYVALDNFGVRSDWLGLNKRGDSATWLFEVYVFVVGEWRVKDIREEPEGYGRPSQWQPTPLGIGEWLSAFWRWLTSPWGMLSSFFVLVLVFALVALAILAWAGVLPMLVEHLLARTKKRG